MPESIHPTGLSRRELLRRAAVAGLIIGPGGALLSSCSKKKAVPAATSASTSTAPSSAVTSAPPAGANPFAVVADAPLDVVIFNGGYTDKYAVQVHEPLYKAEFPKAAIKHESVVEISTDLQPRFAAGNPPDFVNNSGAKAMDFGALVADGQLLDLTPLWDAPSKDDPSKKVRDTVVPGTVDVGSFNGKPFVLYYVSTVFGLWYSGKLFKDNSWTPPTDWDSFIKTMDAMKAKGGITPFGYAGKNAPYYMWNVILTHAAKIGGQEILTNIDNLEDGAWTNPAVKTAADLWSQVGAKYLDKSFEGLIHTDVQLQQDQYKVGFYPSGDWLENEQKKDTPADFVYQMIPIPVAPGGKLGGAGVRATAGEGYVVPAKAKNKEGGLEYMRNMLSQAGGKGFAELIKSPTVVVGASDSVEFPPGVKSSQAALKAAGADVVNMFFDGWYKDLDTAARTATNDLMFGRIKADAFCANIQKKADEIKKDDSITKFKH